MDRLTAGTRIAILSDIHGNTIALDATLADIRAFGGVDGYWLLGDYAAIGYDPVGVLERLSELPNTWFIRGNTDRYLVEAQQPWPSLEDAVADPKLVSTHVHVARSFAWTTGAVATAGWLPWLAKLPLEMKVVLPDGSSVLAVHASPGDDDGFGIHPGLSDEELEALISGVDADLILIGHTHAQFDRTIGGVRLVNPGSVSNPYPPDLGACYALLDAKEGGYSLSFHQAEYDREAVVRATREVNHPAANFIASFMRGEQKPGWVEE